MTQLEQLTELVTQFRRARNWEQFHNPKDQALSLVLEAGEVLEHFQWKNGDDVTAYLENGGRTELQKEMADVFILLLFLAHDQGVDLEQAVREKMAENELKYPVEKAYGVATKYTKL